MAEESTETMKDSLSADWDFDESNDRDEDDESEDAETGWPDINERVDELLDMSVDPRKVMATFKSITGLLEDRLQACRDDDTECMSPTQSEARLLKAALASPQLDLADLSVNPVYRSALSTVPLSVVRALATNPSWLMFAVGGQVPIETWIEQFQSIDLAIRVNFEQVSSEDVFDAFAEAVGMSRSQVEAVMASGDLEAASVYDRIEGGFVWSNIRWALYGGDTQVRNVYNDLLDLYSELYMNYPDRVAEFIYGPWLDGLVVKEQQLAELFRRNVMSVEG